MAFTTKNLKEALRQGPYTFPGCYPIYFITSDASALSYKAVRQNYKLILRAIKDRDNTGWRVVGTDINYEDQQLICDETGERIPCAYGE